MIKIARFVKSSNVLSEYKEISDNHWKAGRDRDADEKKLIELKPQLLKEFSLLVKSHFEKDKQRNANPDYFLGSLDYILDEEFSAKLQLKNKMGWISDFNHMLPNNKIDIKTLKSIYKKEMDTVFGNGTWAKNIADNKK